VHFGLGARDRYSQHPAMAGHANSHQHGAIEALSAFANALIADIKDVRRLIKRAIPLRLQPAIQLAGRTLDFAGLVDQNTQRSARAMESVRQQRRIGHL
jgi:hypothetical protein